MKLSGILVTAALMLAVSVPADAQWGSPERQLATLMERETYDILKDKWSAAWIEVPDSAPEEYGVYYFRKDIELAGAPDSFIVHVSADQRYKLYVNGTTSSMSTETWCPSARRATIRSTGTTRRWTSPYT